MFSVSRLAILIAMLSVMVSAQTDSAMTPRKPDSVTLSEAEILIYLMPVSKKIRIQHSRIAFELQTDLRLNSDDYYQFWVYDAGRTHPAGSVTLGYYAVNKHTAEVWDRDENKKISNEEMVGVQQIIRRTHGITAALIKRYAQRAFWRPD